MTNIDKKIEEFNEIFKLLDELIDGGALIPRKALKKDIKNKVKQALLDIQKETARDIVCFCYASQSERLNQKEFHNYDPNEALKTAYKEITGEDYE